MKKMIVVISISLMVYACGNQDTGAAKSSDSASITNAPKSVPAVKDVTENPDYSAGLELIAKSDCLTCHKIDEKLIGPAYRDVANKYTADDKTINMLANKVIKGGTGVWGPVAMPPHSALSTEDASKMIKYILLLKNK